jgi:hypothetical protein
MGADIEERADAVVAVADDQDAFAGYRDVQEIPGLRNLLLTTHAEPFTEEDLLDLPSMMLLIKIVRLGQRFSQPVARIHRDFVSHCIPLLPTFAPRQFI